MFACICRAVTSDEVSTAIVGGAATVRQAAKATGASTGCGTMPGPQPVLLAAGIPSDRIGRGSRPPGGAALRAGQSG